MVIVFFFLLLVLYYVVFCCVGGVYFFCLGWLVGVIGFCIFFIVMFLIRVVFYWGFKKDYVIINFSFLFYFNIGY